MYKMYFLIRISTKRNYIHYQIETVDRLLKPVIEERLRFWVFKTQKKNVIGSDRR